jgi:uroporphyrinogen III methyltransferase/synthase
VTRPRHQAATFVDLLADAGADVLCCPSIALTAPTSWAPVDAAIARLAEFDWIVFTSVNGVDRFFERLRDGRVDVRRMHRARIAAVGSETARALERFGLLVDVVPDEYRAEAVAEAMIDLGVDGARVLLPRAAAAREVLPERLSAAGATVDEVAVYQTAPSQAPTIEEVRRGLEANAIDAVTFTSSSTVRYFVAALGEGAVPLLRRARVACIGPITAATARELGLTVAVQPATYTVPAFAQAIVAHFMAESAAASMPSGGV